MEIFNKSKASIVKIDGVTYINEVKIDGVKSITIENGKVCIDGKLQENLSSPSIEIKVEGSVGSINTTSGNITVNGDVNSINATSGDVDCSSVKGSVHTISGDVVIKGNVTGSVSTMSGDVYRI